jgi:hypothetical protein
MTTYLILGAGKFGRLALERLAALDRTATFVVVDRDQEALAALAAAAGPGVQTVAADAVDFLTAHLREDAPWDWIIPMVPTHVAFLWLLAGAAGGGWQPVAVPEALMQLATLVGRDPDGGGIYLSRARHWCPDDCLELGDVCPVNGESRAVPLHQELAELVVPGFQVRVLPTPQLASGIGGYTRRQLLDLARDLTATEGRVLVATACRCHGVMHGLARRQGGAGV